MAIERLPEHLQTGRTVEALTSPSAILLAGAGASVAIIAGAALPVAAAAGAAAWAVRVAVALPRRRRQERIDPTSLAEPWRIYVVEALAAQARYRHAVQGSEAGPLRERLGVIGHRIDDGVRACWTIAQRGQALERAHGALDVDGIRRQLAEAERNAGEPWAAGSGVEGRVASLRNQLASAERIASTAGAARDRLRSLEERLDEAAARAVELSVTAHDLGELGALDADVDSIVDEMEALRLAMEETARAS